MNKYLKTMMQVLLACLVLCSFSAQVSAMTIDNEIVPYYVNAEQCTAGFSITDNNASILVRYYGNASAFTKAEISVKIQKRFLLVIWNDVDIGYADNEWTATSYDLYGSFYKEFPISKTGYYRALITVKVYGTSGEVDTIEFTKEYQYN